MLRTVRADREPAFVDRVRYRADQRCRQRGSRFLIATHRDKDHGPALGQHGSDVRRVQLLEREQADRVTEALRVVLAEQTAAAERVHHDVDLLLCAESFDDVDAMTSECVDVEDIRAKRHPHKRAFELDGTMVELLLVESGPTTVFWGETRYRWPPDTCDDPGSWPRLASETALRQYRRPRPPRQGGALGQ